MDARKDQNCRRRHVEVADALAAPIQTGEQLSVATKVAVAAIKKRLIRVRARVLRADRERNRSLPNQPGRRGPAQQIFRRIPAKLASSNAQNRKTARARYLTCSHIRIMHQQFICDGAVENFLQAPQGARGHDAVINAMIKV